MGAIQARRNTHRSPPRRTSLDKYSPFGGTPMSSDPSSSDPLIRVMALHALAYCERLFYLEEVEEIRIADEAVYAGRRLHEELAADEGEIVSLVLESETLGLR